MQLVKLLNLQNKRLNKKEALGMKDLQKRMMINQFGSINLLKRSSEGMILNVIY
jgi:hypothetical protein